MSVQRFRKAIRDLQLSIQQAESLDAEMKEEKGDLQNFKQRQKFAASQLVINALKEMKSSVKLITTDHGIVPALVQAVEGLDESNLATLRSRLDSIATIAVDLEDDEDAQLVVAIPDDIKDDVEEANFCLCLKF